MLHTGARHGRIEQNKKGVELAFYQVEVPYGLAQIQIGVSAGAVEYVPGEDVASLMGRAELAAIRDREPLLGSESTCCEPDPAA